jgi:hypothetical protein
MFPPPIPEEIKNKYLIHNEAIAVNIYNIEIKANAVA